MDTPAPGKTFSAFLPLCLIALSIIIVSSWNLKIAREQQIVGLQISVQQEAQFAQAAQAEAKLKQMMADLLDLSKTDTDAETIVKRYNISFTPPATGTAQPPVSR